MEKITVLILVLSTIVLFCHPYVIMPNVGIKYDLLPAAMVLKYLRKYILST